MTVSREQEKYREWVKNCYKPTIFVPKTQVYINPIPSPIYQVAGNVANHQFITTNNGRPPLLPTPPSPYSPRLSVISSPYATYTPTTNFGFFEGTTTGMPQTILIPASTGAANTRDVTQDIASTQIQLNQSSPAGEIVMSPQQMHYVVPANNTFLQQHNVVTQQQQQVYTQQSLTPSSPAKANPPSIFTVLRGLNNNSGKKATNSNSSSYYNNNNNNNNNIIINNNNNKKWNSTSSINSARNSQRNSPKSSPNLNSRDFSYPPQQHHQVQLQQIPPQLHHVVVGVVPTTATTDLRDSETSKRQESRIYYTAEQLRNLNPIRKSESARQSERIPVEDFDPSTVITDVISAMVSRQTVAGHSNTKQNVSRKSKNKDVIVISDGE